MAFLVLFLVVLLAGVAPAQTPDTASRGEGASVSGVVRDSIAGAPLVGAIVQLVAADDMTSSVRTELSDSLGWFMFEDVRSGRYLLGFLHPMLDSLGVEAPLRQVQVAGGGPMRVDLAIPSPERLRTAICGAQAGRDSAAVIVGVVRDARDRAPMADVAVTAEWLVFSVTGSGYTRRVERVVATTAANGWFALCNVPRPGTTAIIAARGADSTGRLEVALSSEAFLRRDLYLGPAHAATVSGPTPRTDTLAAAARPALAGEGRLDGIVTAAVDGTRLAGVRVEITDGPDARTNERGEFTLVDVPLGTRTLEVRAVGYYPERRVVHVVPGAPPVSVALSTFSAVLDTVRVIAANVGDRYRSGFAERRRMGLGKFLGAEEIARHAPVNASDIFRNIAGVSTIVGIKLRGGAYGECTPSLYINGRHVPPMTPGELVAEDIDGWLRPHEIAGIEVYIDNVPPQFQQVLAGCGSIVIWTK